MPRPQVCVRRAQMQDVEDLLHLWSQAREEFTRSVLGVGASTTDQMRLRLSEALVNGAAHVLIARYDDHPAGYALLTMSPINPLVDGLTVQVEHVWVHPEFRRHGAAKALLTKIAAVAETHGCEQVLSNVAPGSRESARFLARLGFMPFATRRVVSTATLRRKLSGHSQRGGLEDLLSLRRSQRARVGRLGWEEVATLPLAEDVCGEEPASSQACIDLIARERVRLQRGGSPRRAGA